MKELVDDYDPTARTTRVVMDDLSSHSMAALYDTFAPGQTRRIARKLETHDVPTHASWPNIVEIKIGVLKAQCLDRRTGDRETLKREIAAWEKARIKWRFTIEHAREKIGQRIPAAREGTRGGRAERRCAR
jgi:hypothetical protein